MKSEKKGEKEGQEDKLKLMRRERGRAHMTYFGEVKIIEEREREKGHIYGKRIQKKKGRQQEGQPCRRRGYFSRFLFVATLFILSPPLLMKLRICP